MDVNNSERWQVLGTGPTGEGISNCSAVANVNDISISRRLGATLLLATAVVASIVVLFVFAVTASAQTEEKPWKAAVTGLTVSPGDHAGDLAISWDDHPEDELDYRAVWAPGGDEFRSAAEDDWNAFPTANSHTVTGLIPGASYYETVGPVNGSPQFDSGLATTVSVAENTVDSTNIGTAFTATDPDGDVLTYSLSDSIANSGDAANFAITTWGQIRTKEELDFEDRASYSVTVNVTDGKDAADNVESTPTTDASHGVTINVTDVEEEGMVTISGSARGGQTLSAALADDDGSVNSELWQWSRASSANGAYSDISGATSSSYRLVAADVGQFLKAEVDYTDRRGSGKSATSGATTQVAANNVEPSFSVSTATRSFYEDTTTVTNLGAAFAATGGDSDTLTYSLGGTDAGSFTLNTATGQLRTRSGTTYDYEAKAKYSVAVNVRDSKDAAGDADAAIDDTITVTINLTKHPAVTGLTVSPGDNPGELSISWEPHPDGPEDYRVKWAEEDGGYRSYLDTQWNAFPTGTQHTVTGLEPGATYKSQVLARFADRERSAWSAEVIGQSATESDSATTSGSDSPPQQRDASCEDPPTNLDSALTDDGSAVVLTWDSPANCTPDTYAVYRRDMNQRGSRMTKIASVDGLAVSYTDASVNAGETYRYRLRSNDLGARSVRTEIALLEDLEVDNPGSVQRAAPLASPGDLSFNPDDGQLSVSWQDVSAEPAVSSYELRYRVLDTDTWTELPISLDETVDGRTGTTLTGLSNYTVYEIEVAAKNSDGVGPYARIEAIPGPLYVGRAYRVADGWAIQVRFALELDQEVAPDTSRFRVTIDSMRATPGRVVFTPGEPESITLIMGSRIPGDATTTLAYSDPDPDGDDTSGVVQATDGSDALGFTGLEVSSPTFTLIGNDVGPLGDFGVRSDTIYTSGTEDYRASGQSFTTGEDSSGYLLVKVKAHLVDGQEDVGSTYGGAIHLANADGTPGAVIHTLNPVTYDSSRRYEFDAPLGAILEPQTTYVMVIRELSGAGDGVFWKWGSTSTYGGSDWSLADQRLVIGPPITVGDSFAVGVHEIAVVAEVAVRALTPGTPTNVMLTGGEGQLVVSWTGPSGFPEPTSYDLRYRLSDTTDWIEKIRDADDSQTDTLTGLHRSRSFEVQVRSVSGAYASDWSVAATGSTTGTASTDADLDSLSLSDVTLSPEFASTAYTYAGTAGYLTSYTTVTTSTDSIYETVEFFLGSATTPLADADPNQEGHQVVLNTGANTLDIKVTAEDGMTTNTYVVVVTRAAPNAPPTFDSVPATRTLPENSGAGVNVVGGTVTASDDDNDTLTYSLSGTDAGSFEIDLIGQIKTKSGVSHDFDFEATKNSYSVTVNVSDGRNEGGAADPSIDATKDVIINVTDVEETPSIDSGPPSLSFPENTSTATVLGTYAASDDDGDSLTWSLSGDDMGTFTITKNSDGDAELKFGSVPDYEAPGDDDFDNVYEVTVNVRDNRNALGGTDSAIDASLAVTVTVQAVNEAPTMIAPGGTSINVEENALTTTAIRTYSATDPEMGMLSWSLSGDDDGEFTITKNSEGDGELMFASVPDFESPADTGTNNVYMIKVTVQDDGTPPASSTRDVTVSVTNAEEPGTATITGMLTGGSTLTAGLTDPDGSIQNQTYQWMRSDAQNGTFTNITTNGTGGTYDLVAVDVDKYLKVRVNYRDGHGTGKSATSDATGQVDASNAEPTFSAEAATRTVAENSGAGANVGAVVTATDGDTGDTLHYSLIGTDASSFTIDSASGQIRTKAGITYDFEATKNSYTVTVNVRDSKDAAGNADTLTDDSIDVTINLMNVNEAPTIPASNPGTKSFAENTATTTAVATFTANDVDASTTLTWSVEDADDGDKFDINQSSGALTFKDSPNFEMPTDAGMDNIYNATVKVTDNGSPP